MIPGRERSLRVEMISTGEGSQLQKSSSHAAAK
jgi:hypothetical protein